ncbi:MAG: endolytic transglycosylase MltG [Acidobacteriota bacterium]
MKKLIVLILIVLLAAAVFTGYDFYKKVATPFKGYTTPVKVDIMKGSSVTSIAKILTKKKIISNFLYFKIYYRLFFKDSKFRSGEYFFEKPLTMKEVISKLVKGDVLLYKITIKEGLTIKETAKFLYENHGLDYKRFLSAAGETGHVSDLDEIADDLEGYLFPETYLISKSTTESELLKTMVKRFRDNFSESYRWRAKELKMTVREVLTLASLIEKETSSRDERFLISSVFHNRLKLGMPMGCDPTIIYALKREDKYTGKLGWKDLKIDSPYNTRLYKGLPPGPICNPGLHSIEAALFPEHTSYLYFVAKDRKTHYFSKNLKEHNWAVRKYIINNGRNKK